MIVKFMAMVALLFTSMVWASVDFGPDAVRQADMKTALRKVDPEVWKHLKELERTGFIDKDGPGEREMETVLVLIQFDENRATFGRGRSVEDVFQAVAAEQDMALEQLELAFEATPGLRKELRVIDVPTLSYFLVVDVASEKVVQHLAQAPWITEIRHDRLNELYTDEGRALVGSDLAAQSGYTGDGIGVAVIDSNFDLLHPELGGSTSLPNGVVYDGSNFSDPGTPIHSQNFDDCYHGTGTLSIVRRYAPDAAMYALTVFPNAYDHVIVNAINWCISNKNGSNGGSPIKVISMSLGGNRHYSPCTTDTIGDAAGDALANGILVFAATGNDGWTNSMGSPACSPNVISVGSVWDEDGAAYDPFPPAYCNDYSRLVNERACYSDTASFIDVYAPSEEVICAQCGGGTWALGGTSSACPAAAGMTAQFLEAEPGYYGNKSSLVSLYRDTGVVVVGDTAQRRIDLAEALNLNQTPEPTASLTANPSSITEGQSATLSWVTTDATSASISGIGSVSPVASGSVTVSPTTTTTYTLTATGDGGTATASATIIVTSGGGGTSVLENGVSKNFSLAQNEITEYTMDIPANAINLVVAITGTGDADLYVKRSAINWPGDQGKHDEAEFKSPYITGSNESVTFASPAQDTWNVLIHGYTASSGTITATWEIDGGGGGGGQELLNGESQSFSLAQDEIAEWTIAVPADCTSLNVSISGSGDADLYVKRAAINWPAEKGSHNEAEFKAPYISGSNESVTFENPAQDTWHVLVHGYTAASGSIVASWETGGGGGGEPEWHNVAFVKETPHNYANNATYTFEYSYPGATAVAVHFNTLNTEKNYDFLTVYDENNVQKYKVSGNLITDGSGNAFDRTDGWVVISGSKVTIRLVTDYSVTRYGYKTDWASAYY